MDKSLSCGAVSEQVEKIFQKHEKRKTNSQTLLEKKFELRNSLLTELIENNPHIRSLYNVFIAVLICLFVNTVAHDYVKNGEIQIGFPLIYLGFAKLHIVAMLWLGFLSSTCSCYLFFALWAKVRMKVSPKTKYTQLLDSTCLLLLIGYYIGSFRLVALVSRFDLTPASAAIILLEQMRLTMKTYAFIRSNVPKILKYKPHSDQESALPHFSKFLYFLFAPTLIYRNEYPRIKTIRWNFVKHRLLEIVGVILYYNFLLHRFLLPTYEDFGLRKYSRSELMLSLLENFMIGILFFVLSFFLVLHSIQNLFAELLRFGDRMFYGSWWTCTSHRDYFRIWNIIVYDWSYHYIYKDICYVVKNKNAAMLLILTLSATAHEWILLHMFGFFVPALFVAFFFGSICIAFLELPKKNIVNVLFWYELILGCGCLVSVYALEYFARRNTPPEGLDYLLPRFATCDCIE